jgi:hypothetical protein
VVKSATVYSLLFLLTWGALAQLTDDEIMPLPAWSEQDLARIHQGQPPESSVDLLWPMEGAVQTESHVDLIADTGLAKQPSVDISGFLPPMLRSPSSGQPSAQDPKLLVQVDKQYLTDCAAVPPNQYLIDPWQHLADLSGEELERFLAYHAESSTIKAYVLILERNEQLPKDANLQALASGALTHGRSCLAVLPVGEPWRARIFLSHDVQTSVPPVYLVNLAGDCINDAAQTSDEAEQLHRFLIRLSTRLFWLERTLPAKEQRSTHAETKSVTATDSTVVKVSPAEAELTEVLDDPAAGQPQWRMWAVQYWPWAAGAFFLALSSWVLVRRRRYKQRHYEWILPEDALPAETSFGAEHAALVASMNYR